MTTRLNVFVGDDIPDKLATLAGKPRFMGRYITALVRQLHDGDAADLHKFITALDTLTVILESAREER